MLRKRSAVIFIALVCSVGNYITSSHAVGLNGLPTHNAYKTSSAKLCQEELHSFGRSNIALVQAEAADIAASGGVSDCSTNSMWCDDYCGVSFDSYSEVCNKIGGNFCRANVRVESSSSVLDSWSALGYLICLPPSCGDDFDKTVLAGDDSVAGEGNALSHRVELYCDNMEDVCRAEELDQFKPDDTAMDMNPPKTRTNKKELSLQRCTEDFLAFDGNAALLQAAEADIAIVGGSHDCSTDSMWCSDFCDVSFDSYLQICNNLGGTFGRANVKVESSSILNSWTAVGYMVCLPPSCGKDVDQIEAQLTKVFAGDALANEDLQSYRVDLYCDYPEEVCIHGDLKQFKPENFIEVSPTAD